MKKDSKFLEKNNKNNLYILIIVITIIAILVIGTYALVQWTSTENTELTLRIGETSGLLCSKENDISLKQTKVGDRYVLEEMLKEGYNLGGEQSGHIIFLDYNPTGDGILSSLMLVKILLEKNVKVSELSKIINIYPQVLINAKVSSDKKYDYEKDEEIKSAIEKLEKEFEGNGRVLIRTSGTEPLVRVMIEGENQEYIKERATELANLIEQKLK